MESLDRLHPPSIIKLQNYVSANPLSLHPRPSYTQMTSRDKVKSKTTPITYSNMLHPQGSYLDPALHIHTFKQISNSSIYAYLATPSPVYLPYLWTTSRSDIAASSDRRPPTTSYMISNTYTTPRATYRELGSFGLSPRNVPAIVP
jgi:hypothetical protein